MPKSAAERQRERRQRLRQNENEYIKYKKTDRKRKRERRNGMDDDELRELKKRTKLATRKWRTKCREAKQHNVNDYVHVPVDVVFKSPASFGKARRKAERALPKSPRKKAVVVRKLARDVLNMKSILLDSSQIPRTGINDEIFAKVKEFYELDSVSRVMPGKADVITIRCAEGSKEKKQKRHMTMTISEAFQEFKAENPDYKIGKSKFAELRPGNVLLSSKMPHNVCGCKYHNNIFLLLESLHRFNPDVVPLHSNDNFLGLCVCDVESDECMSSNCGECKDQKLFEENIVSKLNLTIRIKWYQWEEDDSGYLEKQPYEGTVRDAIDTLSAQLSKFLWHVYIKRQQAKAYEQDKLASKEADSTSCVLQMDFAENFTVSAQDEIQSAHWKQRQITLYTVTIWHKESTKSWVMASDVKDHEKKMVAACTSNVLDYLGKELPDVKTVKIWTDGPSSQYKNRYIFALIPRLEEHFKVVIMWNYFATSHGKGPNDALGGQAKRIAHHVIMTRKEHTISSADSFTEAILLRPPNFLVTTVSVEDVANWCKLLSLDKLWQDVPPVPGTINTHCVASSGKETVTCKFYTLSADQKVHRVCSRKQNGLATEAAQCVTSDQCFGAGTIPLHQDEAPVEDATDVPTDKADFRQIQSAPDMQAAEPTKSIDVSLHHGTSPRSIKTFSGKKQRKGKKGNHLPETKGTTTSRTYPCSKCDWAYGNENDPKKLDDWMKCIGCKKWFHETCAEDSGIIDDNEKFTCMRCL